MVLLTAWMPFNNGLRPEPIIALGSLITYVLIERSMRYSRMTPRRWRWWPRRSRSVSSPPG
ncbi:mycobacterial cell wall arabinan synthesis family protein [Mycobacterium xenopi 4042]|uniref:Mycobacterial cell wall arabinan synthesis family protein n=1 Tax=Mycobacterium xenopi 4042 TaxID=1299334 RepID=X8DKX1_MYCXE|nr:mycobacterial cell wall arabinan synthesis family protein [Mycobacterium xenopi 4042]